MFLLAAVLVGWACGDDATLATGGPDDGGTTTGTETGPSTVTITTLDTITAGSSSGVVDTTDTASSSGADTTVGDTTGDDTTTGGVETVAGRSVNQLVSAGERSTSRNYTLVYTFGQPSSLQATHASANYHIQGGLIGANGSPP